MTNEQYFADAEMKKHWKESATKVERRRIDALLAERDLLNAELQKLRDRCWKRMKRKEGKE